MTMILYQDANIRKVDDYRDTLIKMYRTKLITKNDIQTQYEILRQCDFELIQYSYQFLKRMEKEIFNKFSWPYYREQAYLEISRIMVLLMTIIEEDPQYQIFFPWWINFKKNYFKVTGIIFNKLESRTIFIGNSDARKQSYERDKLLIQYKNKFSQRYKQTRFTQQGQIPLSKFISKSIDIKRWQPLYQVIKNEKKKISYPFNDYIDYMFKNFHNEKLTQNQYLCCSKFFFQHQTINQGRSQGQFDFQLIQSSKNIDENKLRDTICSFLNSEGGVIFFDCEYEATELKAKGIQITENQKEQIQQKIASMLQCINPTVEVKIHVSFTWVPVFQSPYDHYGDVKNIKGEQIVERNHIKGRYILRILVLPHQANKTYIVSMGDKFYLYKRKNRRTVQVVGEQIIDFFRHRELTNKGKKICHNHLYEYSQSPQTGRTIVQEGKPIKQQQRTQIQYKNISLLICDIYAIDKIKDILNREKMQFDIQESFPQFNLKLTPTTFILYHNTKFDKIKNAINMSNIRYGNHKSVMVISTAKSLQTIMFNEQGMNSLQMWVNSCFPNQKIRQQLRNDANYLILDSNLAAIFIYLVLDNSGISSKFRKLPQQNKRLLPPNLKMTY